MFNIFRGLRGNGDKTAPAPTSGRPNLPSKTGKKGPNGKPNRAPREFGNAPDIETSQSLVVSTRRSVSSKGARRSDKSNSEQPKDRGLVNNASRGIKPYTPSSEEIQNFIDYDGNVLTAAGGSINTTEAQRVSAAYLDDGTFLVDKNNPLSAEVTEVQRALEHQGHKIERRAMVDLGVIRKVYENVKDRVGDSLRSADNVPMQNEVLKLIRTAAKDKCSDIHIVVNRYEANIRMRRDGVMIDKGQIKAAFALDLLNAAFSMADASDTNPRPGEYQSARISSNVVDLPRGVQAIRLQFNPLPSGGRNLVARLLYSASQANAGEDVDSLGYNKSHVRQLKRMRAKPFGINIICGPTGSGKSTTLNRALTAVIRETKGERQVYTIEDPPEFILEGAVQLPVLNAKTEDERSEKFREAISASLRSDPDIVMIGEIRDSASSQLAVTAAKTGHQVWASLHANDAISIFDRLRDHKLNEFDLTDRTLLTGMIGQRLVRKICQHCKLPVAKAFEQGLIEEDVYREMEKICGDRMTDIFYANANGCQHCNNGYSGREVIAETIVPDSKFMDLIRDRKKESAYQYWLDYLDGLTMLEHAIQKMTKGLTDINEVLLKAGELQEFRMDRRELVFGELYE